MGKLSSAFEKAETSAAYPYSMINFLPALGDIAVTSKDSHRVGDHSLDTYSDVPTVLSCPAWLGPSPL